jgi:predicted MFS family arabinose efflux permease
MKSFLSLQLQTAIKVSLAMCIAWVISNFLGFPLSFVAPMLAGVTTLSGLGLGWFLLTRGTLMMAIAFCFGAILSILWGNNYLTIFILVLGMGFWWNYLQLHGFIGSFLGLIISRVNSPPLGAHEKSKKELQYPAACCGVVY